MRNFYAYTCIFIFRQGARLLNNAKANFDGKYLFYEKKNIYKDIKTFLQCLLKNKHGKLF